jgi:hypothetical protein
MSDKDLLSKIIERAEGDDELLRRLSVAIASGDPKEVQRVFGEFGGAYLSEEKAREIISRPAMDSGIVAYGT